MKYRLNTDISLNQHESSIFFFIDLFSFLTHFHITVLYFAPNLKQTSTATVGDVVPLFYQCWCLHGVC